MESKSWFSIILCCYILASFIFSSHGLVSRMLLQEVGGNVEAPAEAPANPPLPAGFGKDSEMAEANNGKSKAEVKRSRTNPAASRNGQNSQTNDPSQQVPNPPPPPPRNSQSVVQNGRQTVVRNGRQTVVTNGNSQSVVTNGGQTVVRNGKQVVVMNRKGQSWVYNSPTGESTAYNSPPPPAPATKSVQYYTPPSFEEQSSTEGPTKACNWNSADCNP